MKATENIGEYPGWIYFINYAIVYVLTSFFCKGTYIGKSKQANTLQCINVKKYMLCSRRGLTLALLAGHLLYL